MNPIFLDALISSRPLHEVLAYAAEPGPSTWDDDPVCDPDVPSEPRPSTWADDAAWVLAEAPTERCAP